MDAVYPPSPAADQPVMNKQRKRPSRKKKNNNSSYSRSSVPNVGPTVHGGPGGSLLFAAPPHIMNPSPSPYFSCPPSLPRQPPLLPLPISVPVPNNPRFYSLPTYNNNINVPFSPTRGPTFSSPPKPAGKITNHFLTQKMPSKLVSKPDPKAVVSPGAVPFGRDPTVVLPKDVRMPMLVKEEKEAITSNYKDERLSSFDDELMTICSPPASSLPVPRFCLRPKNKLSVLSCTAEVPVAADDGITDNLRRTLRLR